MARSKCFPSAQISGARSASIEFESKNRNRCVFREPLRRCRYGEYRSRRSRALRHIRIQSQRALCVRCFNVDLIFDPFNPDTRLHEIHVIDGIKGGGFLSWDLFACKKRYICSSTSVGGPVDTSKLMVSVIFWPWMAFRRTWCGFLIMTPVIVPFLLNFSRFCRILKVFWLVASMGFWITQFSSH